MYLELASALIATLSTQKLSISFDKNDYLNSLSLQDWDYVKNNIDKYMGIIVLAPNKIIIDDFKQSKYNI